MSEPSSEHEAEIESAEVLPAFFLCGNRDNLVRWKVCLVPLRGGFHDG
jgi:hypothetical protein